MLLLATASVSLASLALSAGANAAFTHPLEKTLPVGCSVQDVAVVESTGTLYAACSVSAGVTQIRRFDLDGNPLPFSASQPYISGNAITGDPGEPSGDFDGDIRIDVDNSSAHNGYLYVSGEPATNTGKSVAVFAPSGQWLTALKQGLSDTFDGVAVGPDGSIYASVGNHVSKYSPAFQEVRRLLADTGPLDSGGPDFVRVDSSGALWARYFADGRPIKYEASQFNANLETSSKSIDALGLTAAVPSPFAPNPLTNSGAKFDVDPTNDDLYVNFGDRIAPYSPGDANEPAHQDGPTFGLGILPSIAGGQGVAVTGDGHVYAADGNAVAKFAAGAILPDLTTPTPDVGDVGHASAVLHATLKRAGGPAIAACQIQYGKDTTYSGAGSGTVACAADAGSSFSDASVPVTGSIPDPTLTTGTTYHYRFQATNANGSNAGGDRTVTPVAVLALRTLAAEGIDTHDAILKGSFEPDNMQTTYHFEYGLDTNYGQSTADAVEPASTGTKTVGAAIGNLPAGRTFHYRIVATNGLGTTYGPDLTFRSASPPTVSGVRATDVAATSATLHARIDPVGYATTYHFEYGTSTQYGSSIPAPNEGDAGSGNSPQEITAQISNLQPGVTYHFRVLATNQWDTATSEDTTFDFSPPSCPNAQVRQQTHAGYLPDCRAYELVSPPNAGSVLLFPSEELGLAGFKSLGLSPVNSGLATNPSRFSYWGGIGSVAGADSPNVLFDMYMSTRTNSGWVTTLPGYKGSEVGFTGDKACSEKLDRCVDRNVGDVLLGTGAVGDSAPSLFAADGSSLGQLPTNVGVIPGGLDFNGDQRLSGDFSHYVFSSTDVRFAPGSVKGPPGSAYDNNIDARTVSVISKLPGGAAIPQELDPIDNPDEFIQFPGISTDGSHVLMQVKSADGGKSTPDGRVHLYMRVNDAISYDVSRGHGVDFAGMSADGSKVYFLARQPLGDGDTDTSTDLYRWSEDGDTLTRVSQGNGAGNSDQCAPSWGSKCGVAILQTEADNPYGLVSITGLDDKLARGSGDIYFFSPELLDPARPGIPNQRNLYLYRKGAVQLVATLDPGTDVYRVQISPDGAHAAFLTDSRLTGYDNEGFREVYTYDANTGTVRCASCRPDGLPPSGDVAASQGGPFMSNDGRAFFTTPDPLAPQDTNGDVLDVYEYVAGRPQLISAGTGSRDFTGGSSNFSLLPGANTGLESVSADGHDVFFSTFDPLVAEDHNGPYVKFYDARTSGGFLRQTDPAPCAAADECHGAGSPSSALPSIATDEELGVGGNVPASTPRRQKKKVNKHRAKRHRRHRGHRGGRAGG